MKSHHFILSTGRTGTNFLADYFALYPDCISVHEPEKSYRFRILSNMKARNLASSKFIINELQASRKLILSDKTSNHYIESNNFLFGLSAELNQVFPNSRIVHIVRKPEDYIQSHLKHGAFEGTKKWANRLVPFWFMNVNHFFPEYSNLTEHEQLALRWIKVNELIENHCLNCQLPYQLFLFEDLFGENNRRYFEQLHDFTAIEFLEKPFQELINQRINSSKNKTITLQLRPEIQKLLNAKYARYQHA